MTRRSLIGHVLGGLVGTVGVVGLGVNQLGARAATGGEPFFAERYQGRWITGGGPQAQVELDRRDRGVHGHHGQPVVTVDGVPLHVMRGADGRYVTSVNHYQSFPTLKAAARAAAESLRGAALEVAA
ncbi:tyrosinase family oxidase copper chaperone [Lentzea aerocolonigenes]|uniref:tyrosinase family oxidase copper chaperone n=1 Tax=Lentzea aerocolonigenes TaxID=68170 RepID=UPI0009E51E70|nr:tyrosinase family oxidase copper chaperone [Lentzea aerocolonigenes]